MEFGQFYKHSKERRTIHIFCASPALINNCIESTETFSQVSEHTQEVVFWVFFFKVPEFALVAACAYSNMQKQGFHAERENLPQRANIVRVILSFLQLFYPCIPEERAPKIKKILKEMQPNNSVHFGKCNSRVQKAFFRG